MKRTWIYVLLGIFLFVTGCTSDKEPKTILSKYLSVEQLEEHHVKKLADKETPYTLVYKNNDQSYSLYIFSSPIAYLNDHENLELIDNSIVSSREKKYQYENKSGDVKILFPKEAREKPLAIRGGIS